MVTKTASAAQAQRPAERLQSLERGLEVLAWLNRNGGGRSGQIARALQLTRSTTHRILSVLVELGLLRLDPASHQYFLDAGVLGLSRGFRDDPWIATGGRAAAARLDGAASLAADAGDTGRRRADGARLDRPRQPDLGRPLRAWRADAGGRQRRRRAAVRVVCGEPRRRRRGGRHGADGEGGFPAAELRGVRRQGYYAAATACHTGARLGVPLLLNEEYVGCVIMRCLPETIAAPRDCRDWAESLKRPRRLDHRGLGRGARLTG